MLCFTQCPHIDITSTESDQNNSYVITTINFHVYHLIALYTVHGRRPFNENKQCQLCEAPSDSIVNAKQYTIKEVVIMET